jgi:glyceraldehyde 3-phosphate dehydrogenase
MEILAINDLGDLENLAYLLQYDSVYRKFEHEVKIDAASHSLVVDGHSVAVLQAKDPATLPWRDMNIDIAVEATGLFESFEKANAHIQAGAKRVVLTAPAKDEDGPLGATVLMGINEDRLKSCAVSSNASCTTNSISPVIQVLHEKLGIKKALLSTVHAMTTTQNLADGPIKGGHDYRRGRAAASNIAPSTTGAAIAVSRAVPDMVGRFDGLAFRIPVAVGSLSDVTFVAGRQTSVEEVNAILESAAAEPRWQGILSTTREQLVSTDIIGVEFGAIADLSLTKVIDGDLVKVVSWYDNEAGYVATLIRHIGAVAALL